MTRQVGNGKSAEGAHFRRALPPRRSHTLMSGPLRMLISRRLGTRWRCRCATTEGRMLGYLPLVEAVRRSGASSLRLSETDCMSMPSSLGRIGRKSCGERLKGDVCSSSGVLKPTSGSAGGEGMEPHAGAIGRRS